MLTVDPDPEACSMTAVAISNNDVACAGRGLPEAMVRELARLALTPPEPEHGGPQPPETGRRATPAYHQRLR